MSQPIRLTVDQEDLQRGDEQPKSKSRNRWGLLSKQAESMATLISDIERRRNRQLQWDDFDHNYTTELGNPASELADSGSTLMVFEKKDSNECCVLRTCTPLEFTPSRKRLIELARIGRCEASFLATKCVFNHEGRVWVGSERSDLSLAEIIDGPFDLKEKHVAAVLRQVAQCLLALQECSRAAGECLIYGSLRAQNVFARRNGTVQLGSLFLAFIRGIPAHQLAATFGKDVSPEPANNENFHRDRWGVGYLAIHMITRSSDEPENNVLRQKMLSIGGGSGLCLDAKFEPSPDFIDFLLLCFADEGDVMRLSKHPFLRNAPPCSLEPFLLSAERMVLRNCYPLAI